MRTLLGFAGTLALGLMIAVALAFLVMAAAGNGGPIARPRGDGLDYFSLTIGLVVGIGLGTLGRISWGELPRQIVNWMFANERNFYRLAMAAGFITVLLFY
jgi:hypothetical protein